MSASLPTDIDRTLRMFRPRGGLVAPHGDGWGVAYFEGNAARIFKEPSPAAESGCLDFISHQNFRSQIVIGHVRKAKPATVPEDLANTHPFQRELFGRSVVFAHNGLLPGVFQLPLTRFHPLGETDSEWAFCYLLDRLAEDAEIFAEGNFMRLCAVLHRAKDELSQLGEFNFLLSEGRFLFVYGHTELYAVRRFCRERNCSQKVVLIATNPITEDEHWEKLPPNRMVVFQNGMEKTVQSSLTPGAQQA